MQTTVPSHGKAVKHSFGQDELRARKGVLAVGLVEHRNRRDDWSVERHESYAVSHMHIQTVGFLTFDRDDRVRRIGPLLRAPPLAGDDLIARRWRIGCWRP